MSLTIYSYDGNFRVHKALIAAQYNNVQVDVPSGFTLGKDNETKEFVEKFPNKKVPAMDTPFGPVYESGAIARYIARIRPDTGLLGSNFYQQAMVDQWIDWCGYELEVARGAWLYSLWKVITPWKESTVQAAKEEVHKCLKRLNDHLANRTYLVSNQVTLADITVVSALSDLVRTVLTRKDAEKYNHMARWFNTCVNQPQFQAVLKEVAWAEKEAEGPSSAAAGENKGEGEQKQDKQKQEKKEKPKKEKTEGDQKPKEQQKPKEDKPKKEEAAKKGDEQPKGGSKKDKKGGKPKADS